MQPILGLIENRALRALDHARRHLFAAMRGQAVKEHRVLRGRRHQRRIDAIRKQLAKTLDIDLGAVSVKATSPEGLGALGREEGIAAHAVALIEATG